MKQLRNLGVKGPPVGAIGYGAMGLGRYYGTTKEENAVDVIRYALDEGCSLIDTADAYGNGHNEQLVGRAVANKQRFEPLMKVAEELDITAAQLSLAWLLHQGEDLIPIPGTRNRERVTENAGAADIILKPEILKKISELAPPGLAQGNTLLR